jgi:hypothetical protein
MRLDTLKRLSRTFSTREKSDEDRAHVIVTEDKTLQWHEQLLVTVARVKAFFGYSKTKISFSLPVLHQVHIQRRRLMI